jgi:hypothetical protein
MFRRLREVNRLLHEPGEGRRSHVDGSGKFPGTAETPTGTPAVVARRGDASWI